MRAVFDTNVLVSAVLSAVGAPAEILSRWRAGEFELVVSESLLAELERALGYPKLRDRLSPSDAAAFVGVLRTTATLVDDLPTPAARSTDPADNYLLALAESSRSVLVSGDRHLLAHAAELPVFAPRDFLSMLAQ